jgi:N-acetylmuramoyl-L-alanine amidase
MARTERKKRRNRRTAGSPVALTAIAVILLAGLGLEAAGRQTSQDPARPAQKAGENRIKTVVLDPGHGGIEVGAKGKLGTLEKDVTLAVALKLKALIEKSMAFDVVLTRDRDIDVPIENRAAIANNRKADLFISIHANGSRRDTAQGSETYFMSLNATDEETRRLAYLENRGTEIGNRIASSSEDELKLILWDMAQTAFIRQSSGLAEFIQEELNILLGTKNRGVKQAPFKVLCGVAAPAVLVEVAFISNPEEEKKLLREDYQQGVAQALYSGLAKFLQSYK